MNLSFQNGVLAVVVTLVHMVALSMLLVQPESATEAVSHAEISAATETSLNLAAESVEESPVEIPAPTDDAAAFSEIIDQPALPRVMKPLPGTGE